MAPTGLSPVVLAVHPDLFFISAITAGLSMVIVESGLSHRAFAHRADHHVNLDRLTIGLRARPRRAVHVPSSPGCKAWPTAITGRSCSRLGAWYVFEVVGFDPGAEPRAGQRRPTGTGEADPVDRRLGGCSEWLSTGSTCAVIASTGT